MALAAALSDKTLAKFRTKRCERLLTKNECTFGDRCQYAHSVPRRNPKKVRYAPEMCSSPGSCRFGDDCLQAHTLEEQLYHPAVYRTRLCPASPCSVYYCPHAHSTDELRDGRDGDGLVGDEFQPPAAPAPAMAPPSWGPSGPFEPGMVSTTDTRRGWWAAGELKDLYVRNSGEVPAYQSYGHELCGGLVRPAKYLPTPDTELPCFAKLLPTSRSESQLANRVVKDLRRWLNKCPALLPSPLFLRRTVATTALALPPHFRVLGKTLETPSGGVQQEVRKCWAITQLAAQWIQQLVTSLEALHDLDIPHGCIGPSTVLVGSGRSDMGGVDIRVGDFLGKVTLLRYVEHGCSSMDECWAMWYPGEVHSHMSKPRSTSQHLPDLMKVDSWQLGVLIFFMLTGTHPFGDPRNPTRVCANIREGKAENRRKLRHSLPLFAELVDRLIVTDPCGRLKVTAVLSHPLFWNLQEGFEFAKPLMKDEWRSRDQEWLYHLPCFSVFAPPRMPQRLPDASPEVLSKLCQKAINTSASAGKRRGSQRLGLDALCKELLDEGWVGPRWPEPEPQQPPPSCPPPVTPADEAMCFQAGIRQGAQLMADFAQRAIFADLMAVPPPPGLGQNLTEKFLLQRCSQTAAALVFQHCREGLLRQMEYAAQDGCYGQFPQDPMLHHQPDPFGHWMLTNESDNYAWHPNPYQHPCFANSMMHQRSIPGSPSRGFFETPEAPRTPEAVRASSRAEPDSSQKLPRPSAREVDVDADLMKITALWSPATPAPTACMLAEDHLLPSGLVRDLCAPSQEPGASSTAIYQI